jgi:hypothetical protein
VLVPAIYGCKDDILLIRVLFDYHLVRVIKIGQLFSNRRQDGVALQNFRKLIRGITSSKLDDLSDE